VASLQPLRTLRLCASLMMIEFYHAEAQRAQRGHRGSIAKPYYDDWDEGAAKG